MTFRYSIVFFVVSACSFVSYNYSKFSVTKIGDSKAYTDQEVVEKIYPFSKTGSLTVHTTNGNITIISHDKKEIKVLEIKQGKKQDFDKVRSELIFSKDHGSVMEVYQEAVSCDAAISYEIFVPDSIALSVQSKNGFIKISNVTGTVTAKTTNGEIRCSDMQGALSAHSKNGSIVLTDVNNCTGIETYNGLITFKAKKLNAHERTIKIFSKNGSIVFEVPSLEKNTIEIETHNGDIDAKVTKPKWLINTPQQIHVLSGEAVVKISTKNGRLSVRSF